MAGNLETRPYSGLIALFVAVFATVLGVGMAVPLLPLFAHRLGGDGLHIGMLSAAFAFSRLVCAPWFGRRSDAGGRKRWIVGGLLLYGAISISLGQIANLALLVGVRALHGVAGAMLMPLMQAYAGDVAPRGREGRVMGMYGAVALAGLGLGPVLGGFVNDHAGAQIAFLVAGLLAAAGAVMCALWLPAATVTRERAPERATSWGTLLRHPAIPGLIVFRFCHVVCVGMVWAFLPLYATTTGALSTTTAGLVIGLGIFCSGVLNIPMGTLADRIDRRRLVLAGGLIGAGGIFFLGEAHGAFHFMLASVCFGVGGGVAIPAAMAMVARHGQHTSAMGAIMSLMTSVHSAGMLTGAMVGGLVMDRFALATMFPLGATLLLGGTLVFAFTTRTRTLRPASLPAHAMPLSLH